MKHNKKIKKNLLSILFIASFTIYPLTIINTNSILIETNISINY